MGSAVSMGPARLIPIIGPFLANHCGREQRSCCLLELRLPEPMLGISELSLHCLCKTPNYFFADLIGCYDFVECYG